MATDKSRFHENVYRTNRPSLRLIPRVVCWAWANHVYATELSIEGSQVGATWYYKPSPPGLYKPSGRSKERGSAPSASSGEGRFYSGRTLSVSTRAVLVERASQIPSHRVTHFLSASRVHV
ncbi:hypothetical protein MAPG_04280 [Magnaporthiopsis poae ATCC 64411]|uniref:Uncharacterized protein n=1 Tax=Magnaporthiopsis poae (strain ATCC 64411 / 73-15) TaxID=644358 RepID=A0A0C4DWA6_MAGP6|nr:hypothetical protein MAPG_04280 [Magnaporthiopsis poae ATCC 64411]